jgi:hypothetical protein
MTVERRLLVDGSEVCDFVINEGMGHGFLGTLEGTTLKVGWNGEPGTLLFRLSQAQELAGGPGAILEIIGYASEDLERLVESGRFDVAAWERVLSRRMGGRWRIDVRHGSRIWLTFSRLSD